MTGISIFSRKGFGLAQYLEGLYIHFFNHENCNIFFVDSRYLSSKQEVIMVFIGYSPTGRGPSILMQFIKAQRFHLGACGNGSKYNGIYTTCVYNTYVHHSHVLFSTSFGDRDYLCVWFLLAYETFSSRFIHQLISPIDII